MAFEFSRRGFLGAGLCSVAGCNTIASLEQSATTLDTYDISPVQVSGAGTRGRSTLLVLEPAAPAALSTDRILIRSSPQSVTYLPDGRWVDDLPLMLQSVLIRTISGSGRVGFVGAADAGPVPDSVLLTRIDRFDVAVSQDEAGQRQYVAQVALELTVLRDRDQKIMGSQSITRSMPLKSDAVGVIVAGFQTLMNDMLPDAVGWIAGTAGV